VRPTITVEGSLVFEPKVTATPKGITLAKIRLACEKEKRDPTTGAYVKVDPVFVTCAVWGQMAEQLVESIAVGDWVIVAGELDQNAWDQDVDGTTVHRVDYEVQARAVGVSTRFTTAPTQRRRGEQPTSHDGTSQG